MRTVYLLAVAGILAAMLVAGCAVPSGNQSVTPTVPETTTIPPHTALTAGLARFISDVNETLHVMDQAVEMAATDMGSIGIAGPAVNDTLAILANSSPYASDAVTISSEGRIAAVMPEQYWGAVGVYVGNESHNQLALRERRPLMTPVFPAAEGFDAVSIRWPVWNKTGSYLGLVSIIVNPQQMLSAQADHALAGTNFTAWAMQTDGFLIYDRDPSELVGHNLLTDPLFAGYPDLVALAERVSLEPEGSGVYSFTSTEGGPTVQKEAVWGTVGLHGTEWRLLVAREIGPSDR